MDLDDILQVFFEETDEHLETLERLLLAIDPSSPGDKDINAILRAAHSIKGNSATCGLDTVAKVAHEMESLLDAVRKKIAVLTPEAVDALLEANDNLMVQIDVYKAGDSVADSTVAPICSKLEHVRKNLPGLGSGFAVMRSPEPAAVPATPAGGSAREKLQAVVNTDRIVHLTFTVNERNWPLEHIYLALKEFGAYKLLDKKQSPDQKPGNHDVVLHVALKTDAPESEIRDTLSFVVDTEDNLVIASDPGLEGSDFGLFEDNAAPVETPTEPVAENQTYPPTHDALPIEEPVLDLVFDTPVEEDFPHVDLSQLESLVETEQPVEDPWGMDHLAKPEERTEALSEKMKAGTVVTAKSTPSSDETATLKNVLVAGPTTVMDHPMGTPLPVAKPDFIEGLPKESRKFQRAVDRREAAADAVSLRVNLNKVDQVVDYVGELVIAQNLLQEKTESLDPEQNAALLESLNQVLVQTKALQDSVLAIRMTPMSTVFNRFYRMVRELNSKLGKDVVLKVMGETTEMDKILVEKLVDPMAHLIRNALDHGVETPDVRLARGKPAQGYVMLRAFHRSNNVVIEILDDGAGMDRERLLEKGAERGLLRKPADEMTDSEVWNLIFEPGFSTAAAVTDVSGRGVGMDVVKQNILDLNGHVDVYSAPGKGSKITLTLPLTLSILDGMTVQVSGQSFIMPTNNLLHTMVPEMAVVRTVRGYGKVVEYDGEFIPVARLSSVFELDEEARPYEQGVWLIIESGDARMAVWVERLEGQSQVVLKSLEKNYRKSKGVFGATVLRDGSIALILEPGDVIEMAAAQRSRAWALTAELKV